MTANSKNVHEVLQLMKTLEGETAALYSQISGHASAANPAFADMFSVLAKEEEIHMKYFDMLADVQENENAPFLGKKETLENIDELHAQMHRQIKYISANIAKLTEVEIVKLVLVIENNLLEKHRGFLIKIFDESLLKLFKALEFGDESHQKKLQQFLAEHP